MDALLESMKFLIESHRKEVYITCEDTCWCWAANALLSDNERLKKAVDEAEVVIIEYAIQEGTTAGARDWLKEYRGWVEKEL